MEGAMWRAVQLVVMLLERKRLLRRSGERG